MMGTVPIGKTEVTFQGKFFREFAVVIGVSLLYLRAVGGSLRKLTEEAG